MGYSRLVSKLFEIDGNSLTIMGLQGYSHQGGKSWIIGVSLFNPGDYILFEVSPEPVSPRILQIIEGDKRNGLADEIKYLFISNRVAVILWLEGVITRKDFEAFFEGNAISPETEYLVLKEIEIGGNKYQTIILPETIAPIMMIATLDKDFRVVGCQPEQGPIFAPDTTMNLLS